MRSIAKLFNFLKQRFLLISSFVAILFSIFLFFPSGYITHNHSFNNVIRSAPGYLGLKLKHILVDGLNHVKEEEILQLVSTKFGDSLFDVDMVSLKKNLLDLIWVHSVMIQRRLNGILYIKVVEKKPMALWQNKGKVYLLDEMGQVIEDKQFDRKNLLLFVGEGVCDKAFDFLKILENFSFSQTDIKAVVRVNDRRWNLSLKNGCEILLPEKNVENALKQLKLLNIRYKIMFNSNIKIIDLRYTKKLVLKLKQKEVALDKTSDRKI